MSFKTSNLKQKLEEITELKVEYDYFFKPPSLPYILILKQENIVGADEVNNLREVNIDIELYSAKNEEEIRMKIKGFLNENKIKYSEDSEYINSEKFNLTIYNFNILEK